LDSRYYDGAITPINLHFSLLLALGGMDAAVLNALAGVFALQKLLS